MHAAKELGSLPDCSSRDWSMSRIYGEVLKNPPRISYHNPPAAALVEEIANLELEVIELERYLLSLYRTAFGRFLPNTPAVVNHESWSPSGCLAESLERDAKIQAHQAAYSVGSNHLDDKGNQSCRNEKIVKTTHDSNLVKGSSFDQEADSKSNCTSPKQSPQHDMLGVVSRRRILADHLATSIADHIPDFYCKLSEDIVRCISAIYCKLANPPTQQMDVLASPTPSVSSSSTSSPHDRHDSWSPRCPDEGATSPCRFGYLKSKKSPYSNMLEVSKMCIDGEKFEYASKMLSIYRSLIRRLETVDPRKMEHEMQVAFWINIHNALVMHAFIAYGLHHNRMKNTSSIMKAAYDVGGHSVNPCVIQKAILGCQIHRPALSIHTLFSPSIKILTANVKHAFALDRPEPLAHFGLCLGAYSDPAVRVYTAEGVHHELSLAKTEFIQATVSVRKETMIKLPKVLQYYAKDASLELSNLVEMVRDCMPEDQQKAIRGCLNKKKVDKSVLWASYKLSFRYLVQRDLAK